MKEKVRALPWWMAVTWTTFAVSVLPTLREEWDYVTVVWIVTAVLGLAAAVLGFREWRGWIWLAAGAGAALFAVSVGLWIDWVDKVFDGEAQRSIGMGVSRYIQMLNDGLRAGARTGIVHLALATTYREAVMPVLQAVTVVLLAVLPFLPRKTAAS